MKCFSFDVDTMEGRIALSPSTILAILPPTPIPRMSNTSERLSLLLLKTKRASVSIAHLVFPSERRTKLTGRSQPSLATVGDESMNKA